MLTLIMGEKPYSSPNNLRSFSVDPNGNALTTYGDTATLDAFGRLRISNPVTLFDSQQQYNDNPLTWGTTLTGSGTSTHLPNESSVRMRCTTASGDKVVRQTHKYFRYQSGKSLLLIMTGVMGALKTNTRQRIGYFDANNGIFFEQDGTNLKVVRRTFTSGAAVDNAVNQSSWNIDKMDGTGISGITLDMSKSQIFLIDIEWLGVGRVRMGVVIDGKIYYCHQFLNANNLSLVYMTTANLPLRYELENTGASASTTDLIQICQTVISEGGFELTRGIHHSANNGTTSIAVTTRRAVLTIRPKATFNDIANRGLIVPEDINTLVTTNNALIEIVYNGTLGGTPSWTSAGSNSIVEYDVAGTTVTGGEIISSYYIAAGSGNNANVLKSGLAVSVVTALALNFDGTTQDTFSVVVTSMSGTANITTSVDWFEIY